MCTRHKNFKIRPNYKINENNVVTIVVPIGTSRRVFTAV